MMQQMMPNYNQMQQMMPNMQPQLLGKQMPGFPNQQGYPT
jgi:hypothetical protein